MTQEINQLLTMANINYTLARTYAKFPFMCRKNSTSDRYYRLGDDCTNQALFLLFKVTQ